MTMNYKPPVKTSVSNFFDNSRRRRPTGSQNDNKTPLSRSEGRIESQQRQTSSQKNAHAASVAQPDPRSHQSMPFEQRMRNLVLKSAKKVTRSRKSASSPTYVRSVDSWDDYQVAMAEARQADQIVCARFYAPWCKACHKAAPHFYQMAKTFTLKNKDVVFWDVPVTDGNVKVYQGLGVTTLPYGHIYTPYGGLVQESKLLRPHVADFRAQLQQTLSEP